MSKGDIENTIRCYLDLPHDQKPIGWVGQLAREIAQAAEEDRAELMAVANNTRELWIQSREEATKLRAQVAMMGNGLRGIRDEVEPSIHLSSMDLKVWNMAVDTLCLSGAPKVAWYGTMYIGEDSIGPVLMDPDPKCPWPELIRGQQVKVFVVECPPESEQPTESEQGATDD